jgi:hypothetical protein
VFVKSLSINKLYKKLGFKIKELYNINNVSNINKYKVICFRVSEYNQGYTNSIL